MRELLKSMARFSYATSLLVAQTAARSLGPVRVFLDCNRRVSPPGPASASTSKTQPIPESVPHASAGIDTGRLDTSSFVVLGEGLAAGMGDFCLSADSQRYSFPAQMARQMNTPFIQPLIESPGIGNAIGFEPWPVIVPSPLQSLVIENLMEGPVQNLSVPGLTVSDSIRLRPQPPLIDRNNAKQTLVNLILGCEGLLQGQPGILATQAESAAGLRPTLVIMALGYAEALAAATSGNLDKLPSQDSFRMEYSEIIGEIRKTGAETLLFTIPDPATTAYFSKIEVAAAITRLEPQLLAELWNIRPDELITVKGLNEISFQVYAQSIGTSTGTEITPLPSQATLSAETAAQISLRIEGLNQEIRRIAEKHGAQVFDFCSLIKTVQDDGLTVQGRRVTGEYLGGFYSLNGYYPGATGHAFIANEVLKFLNKHFHASFPLIDLETIFDTDPVAGYKQASGPNWSRQNLMNSKPLPLPGSSSLNTAHASAAKSNCGVQSVNQPSNHTLKLPPGLEQVLPIDSESSFFGDALTAQHCRTPATMKWASGNNLFFGGLALMNSHLSGNIRLKFTPPVGDWTTFELSFQQGLTGTNSYLAAPIFFKMPGKQQVVSDVPGQISGGRLNLVTGEIDPSPGSLNIYVGFFNSALFALLRVNPNFPTQPLSFPGQYGSARIKFEQRHDGKLDFTFQGSTFVPLGEGTAFPLNFCGPSRQFASIPANGTALHPRIAITTKARSVAETSEDAPDIPFNTVQEFTLYSAASSFGDLFTLNTPEMGGPGLGRSRLYGRAQIQFGPRCGNSVPIAVSTTCAGGMLAPMSRTPIAQLFPGKLTPGPEGFYENLRFPMLTYSLNDLSVIDDPFDISVGALDVRTGELIHPLLQRGFINQDLIFALLRVEPRTPTSSFFFEGPGALKKGVDREHVFRFFGAVHIPYPQGFLFPDPNLATGFPVVNGGSLDPYLWIWSIKSDGKAIPAIHSSVDQARSSRGDAYSYRFMTDGAGYTEFEYENHSQQGKFRMSMLLWTDFAISHIDDDAVQIITFTCCGTWTKDGVERIVTAAAQLASAPSATYTGIQIGPGGETSNVNTLSPSGAFPLPFQSTTGQKF